MNVFVLITNSEKISELKTQENFEDLGCIEIQDEVYGCGIMVPENVYGEVFTDPEWETVFDELKF
jgi:hypothetical protein